MKLQLQSQIVTDKYSGVAPRLACANPASASASASATPLSRPRPDLDVLLDAEALALQARIGGAVAFVDRHADAGLVQALGRA
jgi:hypothetical protein